jgi:hypothetical protein
MQTTQQNKNLVRKQIMLSNSNISKLEKIASAHGSSMAEIVRLAVDRYDPNVEELGDQELMSMVSEKLKAAIKETQRVSRRVKKTVEMFEAR